MERTRPIPTPPAAAVREARHEGFVQVDGREMYCIPRCDDLQPFLMSLVSDSDLWMFISSTGGLTAGRRSPENALFGYETDDRLHHLHGVTGPITLVRPASGEDDADVWTPFGGALDPALGERRLYKSVVGNCILFEEENRRLDLVFRYRWESCDEFGFVRTATLINRSRHASRPLDLVDGLLNLLPAGVELATQQTASCLADAYKFCEVDRESRLAIYSLNSLVSDRAEPAECLLANVAWCRGLPGHRILLSEAQLRSFRLRRPLHGETRLRGQRGSFLVAAHADLRPGEHLTWMIVADVARTQAQTARLRRTLLDETDCPRRVRERVDAGTDALQRMVAAHDGLQASADRRVCVHHFANVLFNLMRGGALVDAGRVRGDDFAAFVASRDRALAARHASALRALPETLTHAALVGAFAGEPALRRLALEFLPLTFGRRHGDPSRPWNRFEIRLRDAAGRRTLAYQGNWRDIFQNWEALCLSFPDYLPAVIAKFVNASTVDGFNPYRLSHEGVDWEAPDPGNPWANIGYWGDHQIVYLTRLLEPCQRFHPGALRALLGAAIFTYADVPYRLKPYDALLRDCRGTIEFDADRDRRAHARAAATGGDGRLVHAPDGEVLHVTLAEKLLVPVLSKLANLVLDGGVWMNTQRPEWNDANNALAGHGLSVVTTCHLRRHVALLIELFAGPDDAYAVSGEVADWLDETLAILRDHAALLERPSCGDGERRRLLDALGQAFGRYRARAYANGPGAARSAPRGAILEMLRLALGYIDHTIRANRRSDGLYHAYNLLTLGASTAGIERQPEMLEGQVAALSAGLLTPAEAVEVVRALLDSALYCPARRTFLLYPDRATASFLEKNVVPSGAAEAIDLLRGMLEAADERIVARDDDGTVRFAASLRNAADLERALDALAGDAGGGASVDRAATLALYESVFRHHAFTGRSGSMFGYEGLGSVYWHMVAKLLVAVQEAHAAADAGGADAATVEALADAYERIREGLGFNKSAQEYGAFPTDPYSHSPSHAGARQPGMTGQVKEEILTRWGELGVRVDGGAIRFAPRLLSRGEFTVEPTRVDLRGLDGAPVELDLSPGALAFTLCQTPVVYRLDVRAPRVLVVRGGGRYEVIEGDAIDAATARQVFERTGEIVRIEVSIDETRLRARPVDGRPVKV